jgi:hypothetical protein
MSGACSDGMGIKGGKGGPYGGGKGGALFGGDKGGGPFGGGGKSSKGDSKSCKGDKGDAVGVPGSDDTEQQQPLQPHQPQQQPQQHLLTARVLEQQYEQHTRIAHLETQVATLRSQFTWMLEQLDKTVPLPVSD